MSSLLYYIRHELSNEEKKIILDRIDNSLKIQPRTTSNQYSYIEPHHSQIYNYDYDLPSMNGPEFSISDFK
jgi:hypothetical protein